MTSVRVLHVDDEPDIRQVVEISLGNDPTFAVRSCASGGEAIATTAKWLPDLILLDAMMPGMDGPTTLARLRQCPQTAKVPVIFITAKAQASELDRFLALGAAGVISKPFDPMTLAALIRPYALAESPNVDGGHISHEADDVGTAVEVTSIANPIKRESFSAELQALRLENQRLRELVIQLSKLVIKRVVERFSRERIEG